MYLKVQMKTTKVAAYTRLVKLEESQENVCQHWARVEQQERNCKQKLSSNATNLHSNKMSLQYEKVQCYCSSRLLAASAPISFDHLILSICCLLQNQSLSLATKLTILHTCYSW